MDASNLWQIAKHREGIVLLRWTKTGRSGQPFTYKIRDAGRGPAIGFFRENREVKSASFDRFKKFYDHWRRGHKSADYFQNHGPLRSEAQVARFLIPVFEMVAPMST